MRKKRDCFAFGVYILFFASITISKVSTASENTALLFPLTQVNTDNQTVTAVEMILSQLIERHGITIVFGNDLKLSVTTPPTVDAPNDQAQISSEEELSAKTLNHPLSLESMSLSTVGAGCRFFITGSVAQLGEMLTVNLSLHLSNGAKIIDKKVTSPNERSRPQAMEVLASSIAQAVQSYKTEPVTITNATSDSTKQVVSKPNEKNDSFQRNFGLAIGQTFGVFDNIYSYMSILFNARFEFSQLLMITNAGFSLANRDPGDAFHFSLNMSLAGYLLKSQVSPYIGGGFGFFIGNRMKSCEIDVYGDEFCSGEGVVGWDIFPVIGLEILKNTFMRVHIESRYLITFNGNHSWGHGPSIFMGVAF